MSHALIIEDEVLIAMDMKYILASSGFDSVSIAATEDAAVDAARQHKPDFILSDVSLRKGTGPAAVQRIQTELGWIATLFLTATPDRNRGIPMNAPILLKPADETALKRTIALIWNPGEPCASA